MAGEMDFYSTLEQLVNPTHDLGGGPGADSAKAISQLILGGGSAALQGANGQMQPLFGNPSGVPQGTARAPVSENLRSVLDTADQVANSLNSPHGSGAPITSTLLPNPYGRGSYDPANADAVAQVQSQGKRAQHVDTARQFISQLIGQEPTLSTGHKNTPEELLAYQQASNNYRQRVGSASPIVKSILENLGVAGESEYQKAFDRQKGKVDAGGGNMNKSYADLLKSAGSDDFHEKMAIAAGDGSLKPNEQLALERHHDKIVKEQTVPDPDRRSIVAIKGSVGLLDKMENSYKQTEAFKTGKFSDDLKNTLALSARGNVAVEQLPIFQKLTPAEQQFVADYNVFGMNLRQVANDSRFSNFDAAKVLEAIGTPLVGRDMFLAQLGAAKENLIFRHDDAIDGLASVRKDVRGFKRFKEKAGSTQGPKAPQVGEVIDGHKFKGGDPRDKNNWEKQ